MILTTKKGEKRESILVKTKVKVLEADLGVFISIKLRTNNIFAI